MSIVARMVEETAVRSWQPRITGAALVFWAAGPALWTIGRRTEPGTCTIGPAQVPHWSDAVCGMAADGAAGQADLGLLAAAAVAGSALAVAAVTPKVLHFLAGVGWPQGSFGGPLRRVLEYLLLRQATRRAELASARFPARTPEPPAAAKSAPVPTAQARRDIRQLRRHNAQTAADDLLDSAARARLRRYPSTHAVIAPTRLGNCLLAAGERIRERHGLDLDVCWELLLTVLPPEVAARLNQQSATVLSRAQGMLWAAAAAIWAFGAAGPTAAAGWIAGIAILTRLYYAGLCPAVEAYCDIVEAVLLADRHLLYRAAGLEPPRTTGEEPADGRTLSLLLRGVCPEPPMPLTWHDIDADDHGAASEQGESDDPLEPEKTPTEAA
jgi:hypothetical protein